MTDFVEDFLNEAALQLSDLESFMPMLTKNLSPKEGWDALYVFFDFIRSVAPFAGFMRSYRLADAALREIRECQKKGNILEGLPAVMAKLQRIKDILIVSERLKREIRESDDDLLPSVDDEAADLYISGASKSKNTQPDIVEQETILDKREEELVLWAQALAEQENALKDKENILFKEERTQSVWQEKVDEALKRLSEKEKLQSELEECLAETRLMLQECQEKLAVQENLHERSEHLLEMKDAALNDTKQKNQELAQQLAEEEKLSEEHKQQLFQELEKKQIQNKRLLDHLKRLEKTHLEMNENREQIFSQYAHLEEEYQTIQRQLKAEKETKDQILQEKRELEKQHLDFSSLMLSLQEQLDVQEKSAQRSGSQLKKQKYRYEALQSDLQVAGWPYDTGKFQKELAVLARQYKDEAVTDSLTALKGLIVQIRTRSFIKIPYFFKNIVHITAGRYQRPYKIDVQCDVINGLDKDALSVLEQILLEFVENAFQHASCKDGEELHLSFSAREEGTAVCCSFKDNGCSFDFDRLYNAVLKAGLINKNTSLSRPELLAYLFHNVVTGRTEKSGLIKAARLLEKSGGHVAVDFKDGLQIDFSIPKRFLFDNVLLFRLSDNLMAVPLNSVAETVFLKKEDLKKAKGINGYFFCWRGLSIPVLELENVESNNLGLVIQAGAFSFLIPIQQIEDTEYILSFSERKTKKKTPYLTSCTVLESGREPMFLDIAEMLKQTVLPLPRRIISNTEEKPRKAEQGIFYLIFKSEPSVFGAVRIDSVLRVENFAFSPKDSVRKKFLETQGIQLPLKDSCPRDGYPHAQAVLIFEKFALAIQEVVDVVEIPNIEKQEDHIDFIAYRGRKVSVFSTDV